MIQSIDQLNIPIMQKHHVRILAHCLELLRSISDDHISLLETEDLLKEWCNNQSRRLNDQNFSDLLYEQLVLTAKKLNNFAQKIGKKVNDLDINDLVYLVQES